MPGTALSLALIGCATASRPASNDREVRSRAETLCRFSVFERVDLEFARHDSLIASLVEPRQIAAIPPCEGDLADVDKCAQDITRLSFERAMARHVHCDVLGIERLTDDVFHVFVRHVAPVLSLPQARELIRNPSLELGSLPTRSAEHVFVFRRLPEGWFADFGPP